MIIEFALMGSGQGKDVTLCDECFYSVKVRYRSSAGRLPTLDLLTGAQIKERYGNKDVKVQITAISRVCRQHKARKNEKPGPDLMNAALKSGIDILPEVDKWRYEVLNQRHPIPQEN